MRFLYFIIDLLIKTARILPYIETAISLLSTVKKPPNKYESLDFHTRRRIPLSIDAHLNLARTDKTQPNAKVQIILTHSPNEDK
ncbi:hypothetical protein [Paenibacillus sp. 2KB_22]|uniref:hypothetical protein n=1 Tax=Paenibacillus sp. 2KB_22 TaxID=3232978 RepID=UPI003F99D3DC